MNKRNLLNLGLLAFIGILILLVLYEPGIEEPAELPTLLQLDRETIQRIFIQRDSQQDVELAKDENGHWWMEKPIRHPADPLRLDSLLRITTLKSQSSFSVDGKMLAEYQLDKPRASITLNDNILLAFGGNTPLDHRRYIMLDGQVHLTTDSYYYHLIGSFPTFLRKQLLDEGSRIEAITLPGLTINWQEERWQPSPEPATFSADQVTKLIDNWRLAAALEIKPYDGQPGEEIAIKLDGAEHPFELLLTSREPDLILARPALGIQYHFSAASAGGLLQLPAMEPDAEADSEEMEDPAAPEHTHQH